MEICINPNEIQLSEIKIWLLEEYRINKTGFYCNWNIIEGYFNKNQLIVLLKQSKVIGFSTYEISDGIAVNLDIMEIHPKYRKSGNGSFLMTELFNFCIEQGALVARLFCSPEESYFFWKRMGFLDFPETGYSQPRLSMYKVLVETRKPVNDNCNQARIIELWDCEPYMASRISAKWTWLTEITKTKVEPPIIVPCDRNWKIRYSVNGKVIKESKIKHFSNSNPIDLDKFMVIRELSQDDHPSPD